MSKRKHATGVEALDAIVAEMCDEMTAVHLMKATDLETLHSIQAGLRKLADRIVNAVYQAITEAATKAAADAVNLTDEKWRRQCGDAAKMREALVKSHSFLGMLIREDVLPGTLPPEASDLADDVWDALSAPPRNCDRFATAEEAIAAHKQAETNCPPADCPECPYIHGRKSGVDCLTAWIFAPAAQEGGGDHESK